MSDAEQQAVLEGQLEASIAGYDGMIQREQDYINDRARRQSEAAAEEVASSGIPYDDPSLEDEEPSGGQSATGTGEPASGSQSAETTVASSGKSPRKSGSGPNGNNRPADIPDGSDDDVVARQIREAAEQETDPVLREKLWEEYRKYKNGQ